MKNRKGLGVIRTLIAIAVTLLLIAIVFRFEEWKNSCREGAIKKASLVYEYEGHRFSVYMTGKDDFIHECPNKMCGRHLYIEEIGTGNDISACEYWFNAGDLKSFYARCLDKHATPRDNFLFSFDDKKMEDIAVFYMKEKLSHEKQVGIQPSDGRDVFDESDLKKALEKPQVE